jgi:hypothetical protein
MTAAEKAEESRARAEGKRNRQRFIDSLLELVTDPETDSAVLREARAAWLWFPEGKQLVDRIQAVYKDQPEVCKTVMLSAIIAILDRLTRKFHHGSKKVAKSFS